MELLQMARRLYAAGAIDSVTVDDVVGAAEKGHFRRVHADK
jgi:hypothetical protein